MCHDSTLRTHRHVKTLASRTLMAFAAAVLVWVPSPAQAQTTSYCSPAVKEEVAKALSAAANYSASQKLALEAQLYEKYKICALDNQFVANEFHVAARQCSASVSNLGSLFYEEMSCCGYDPQRRQFACPVKIKQTFGFGGAPLPGSREYVLHCVADASGVLVPVGDDSVHLANALAGQSPPWQFAVVAAAKDNLHTVQPMNGQTRRARSILSWGLRPTNCNYTPIWGNALNYRIRLDQ